jgi:hypothetical protein
MCSTTGMHAKRVWRRDLLRPYRIPGYPLTPALFIAAAVGMLIDAAMRQPLEVLVGLFVLALGAIVHRFWRGLRAVAHSSPVSFGIHVGKVADAAKCTVREHVLAHGEAWQLPRAGAGAPVPSPSLLAAARRGETPIVNEYPTSLLAADVVVALARLERYPPLDSATAARIAVGAINAVRAVVAHATMSLFDIESVELPRGAGALLGGRLLRDVRHRRWETPTSRSLAGRRRASTYVRRVSSGPPGSPEPLPLNRLHYYAAQSC